MSADRIRIDLNSPLAREREGVKLTQRSLSGRLADVIERLGRVTETAMPKLPAEAWDLILWQGWDAISNERIISADRPAQIDELAWMALIHGVADWIAGHEIGPAPPWSIGLVERLDALSVPERIAVLERIEAYGRDQASR